MKKIFILIFLFILCSFPANAERVQVFGGGGSGSVSDTVYGAGWDGDTTVAPSKNAVYDKIETIASGGDNISVNSTGATNANFLDNLYIDYAIDTAATPDDITSKFNYAETLAGNPALLVDECVLFKDATGGGFICEGSTADTAEQLYRFPDVNGSDTTTYFALTSQTDGTIALGTDTSGNYAAGDAEAGAALTGDSATSFFSSGTLEVAIGGTGTTTSTGTGAVVLGTSPTFTTDVTFPALSIEAGALAAASVDGDDINSNLAGRSLTLTAASPDTLDADAELYTIRFNAGIENPVAADDDIIQIEPAGAFTITEIACSTDTGTATINFNENVNTTPNTAGTAILSADIVCDTGRQSSCASGCDVNTISNGGITAGNLISMITTSVASTPTKLRIHIKGTYDD